MSSNPTSSPFLRVRLLPLTIVNSVPTSRTSRKSHLTLVTNTPRHQVNGKGSKSLGAHPTDETAIIAGSSRAPPPQEIMKSNPSASVPGKKANGSLLSWRVMGETTSEPSARALNLHNPHNLCYMQTPYYTCFIMPAHSLVRSAA